MFGFFLASLWLSANQNLLGSGGRSGTSRTESAIQSISNTKNDARYKRPRRHWPKAFQSPEDGIIARGLPPLGNQERKKGFSSPGG
jgi:hypothetical protein